MGDGARCATPTAGSERPTLDLGPVGAYFSTVEAVRSYHDYGDLVDRVLARRVGKVSIAVGRDVFERTLREEPRLVIVANHGPPHVPLVGMCAVARCMIEAGHGGRRPLAIAFRAFYRVPGVRSFFAYLTQLPEPLPFEGILQHFEAHGFNDLCIAPEGQNSVFGDPRNIRAFASPRFVELAVRVRAPILVAVGVGMEAWARPTPLPNLALLEPAIRWVSPRLGDAIHSERTLCLPVSMKKIPELVYGFELHRPRLDHDTFCAMPARERRKAISEEAVRLRVVMQDLADRVRAARPEVGSAQAVG